MHFRFFPRSNWRKAGCGSLGKVIAAVGWFLLSSIFVVRLTELSLARACRNGRVKYCRLPDWLSCKKTLRCLFVTGAELVRSCRGQKIANNRGYVTLK